MKKIIVLFTLIILGFSSGVLASSVNPGEDPNLGKSNKTSEADVAATGICPECIARLKHSRMQDNTAFRPSTGGQDNATDGSKPGTK